MGSMGSKRVALIVGAGNLIGTGSSIARLFSANGYTVVAVRRTKTNVEALIKEITSSGGKAFGYGVDTSKEDQVVNLIEEIESKIGPIEVAVSNGTDWLKKSILEITADEYRHVWENGCFAGFLVGREVAKRQLVRGHGTIIFTGATSSLHGSANFPAFSGTKFGLRALSQSMATRQ